jgi:hypothetical protein
MSRISCRNEENPENQADQFGAFLPKNFGKNAQNLLKVFIIFTTNPWHGGVYKVRGKSWLRGYRNCYGGSLFEAPDSTLFLLKNVKNWSAWLSGFSSFQQLTLGGVYKVHGMSW